MKQHRKELSPLLVAHPEFEGREREAIKVAPGQLEFNVQGCLYPASGPTSKLLRMSVGDTQPNSMLHVLSLLLPNLAGLDFDVWFSICRLSLGDSLCSWILWVTLSFLASLLQITDSIL